MDDFDENEICFHWMDEQVRVLTLTLVRFVGDGVVTPLLSVLAAIHVE